MDLLELKGIGDKTCKKFNELGIFSLADLIEVMPRYYIDFSKPTDLAEANEGDYVLIEVIIDKLSDIVRTKGLTFFSAQGIVWQEDKDCKVELVWFNQPYLRNNLSVGEAFLFWGKVKIERNVYKILNPSYEPKNNLKRFKGVAAIYKTRGVVSQTAFSGFVSQALNSCKKKQSTFKDFSETEFSLHELYVRAHSPKSVNEGFACQRRIALEDCVKKLIAFRCDKRNAVKRERGCYVNFDMSPFNLALPFVLSPSQEGAIAEIINDLNGDSFMNRMLQGDVGSGKTIVAFACLYVAAKNGHQAVLMSPTVVLTKQHYIKAKQFFDPLGIKVQLLSSDQKKSERKSAIANIKCGIAQIIIATHSVLQDNCQFKSLKLIVIDEMHRFGVRQRGVLQDKASEIDTLVMSATPIPRAVMLMAYGDLDVSVIEKRKQRSTIKTYIMTDSKLNQLIDFINKEGDEGNQTYIVCPRVEDTEGIELFGAKSFYNQYACKFTHGAALLYGGMNSAQKSAAMNDFYEGKIKTLIATTVIEVGVDVAKASVMVVLNAQRFGLSTLHQLRGRVGRGSAASHCFFVCDKDSNRVRHLKGCEDGFELARLDFETRGCGEFLGDRQSGKSSDSKFEFSIGQSFIDKAKEIVAALSDSDIARLSQRDEIIELQKLLHNITLN